MIAALLCVCQLAAGATQVMVRSGEASARIELAASRGVAYVEWSVLQSTLGARIRMLPTGRSLLEVGGAQFELAHGVPFVRFDDRIIPLSAAPRVREREVDVPLQLLAQVLPSVVKTARYDVRTRTITMAGATIVAESAPAPVKNAVQQPVAPPTGTRAASDEGTAPVRATVPQKPVTPNAANAKDATPVAAKRRIVVDAGHGGPDEGTSVVLKGGQRITEKSITLAVSRMLGEELTRRNFDVVYTRKRDTLIALHDRGRLANAALGSAFISVHVNAAGSGQSASAARGVETYFLSVAKTEDAKRVAALENASVQFEEKRTTEPGGNPLSFIINDMQQNDHLRESSALAARIQGSLAKVHPGPNRGVKQAEFAVLVGSFMPSVLVEIGFLSNQQDALFLSKAENQRKLALSIADAVSAHFGVQDRAIAASEARK